VQGVSISVSHIATIDDDDGRNMLLFFSFLAKLRAIADQVVINHRNLIEQFDAVELEMRCILL